MGILQFAPFGGVWNFRNHCLDDVLNLRNPGISGRLKTSENF